MLASYQSWAKFVDLFQCKNIWHTLCFFMLTHIGDFCQWDFDSPCLRGKKKKKRKGQVWHEIATHHFRGETKELCINRTSLHHIIGSQGLQIFFLPPWCSLKCSLSCENEEIVGKKKSSNKKWQELRKYHFSSAGMAFYKGQTSNCCPDA